MGLKVLSILPWVGHLPLEERLGSWEEVLSSQQEEEDYEGTAGLKVCPMGYRQELVLKGAPTLEEEA